LDSPSVCWRARMWGRPMALLSVHLLAAETAMKLGPMSVPRLAAGLWVQKWAQRKAHLLAACWACRWVTMLGRPTAPPWDLLSPARRLDFQV
jgi:hypothetical protein